MQGGSVTLDTNTNKQRNATHTQPTSTNMQHTHYDSNRMEAARDPDASGRKTHTFTLVGGG